jgi:hypothetical protein
MVRFVKDPRWKKAENNTKKRQDWHSAFVRESMLHEGCFVTSSPGASEVTVEVVGNSPWVQELKDRGFPIRWVEDGQRIIPNAIIERVPLVEGSTQPPRTVVHAGIVATKRYAFRSPY